MVAWPDRRGKNVGRGQHIFGQRVSAGGELVAKPFRISSKRLTDNLFVVLTHDRQHARYLVVWHGDESNDFSTVFGRWIHADGRRDGPTFRITDDEAFHVRTPAVVSTAQPGRYLVAWRDDRREGTGQARVAGIFAQVVDADGDLHGDNLEIPGRNARWASGPALAHDPKTEQTLAVWSDSRRRKTSGEDIFGQLFSE